MRIAPQQTLPRRAGLTLVEMLVALALTIFMMSILSEAFVTGLETMSRMKALADLEQRLRDVGAVMKRDLKAAHFEGNRRLSDLTTSGQPIPKNLQYSLGDPNRTFRDYRLVTPDLGYFAILEEPNRPVDPAAPTRIPEGIDNDGRPSDRDYGDELAFTARLSGKDRTTMWEGFVNNGTPMGANLDLNFTFPPAAATGGTLNHDAPVLNSRYMSPWAEICYFLRHDRNRATAQTAGLADNNSRVLINTFVLYRRQLLLVPESVPADATTRDATDFNFHGQGVDVSGAPGGQYARWFFSNFDISAAFFPGDNRCYLNSPADVQHPARRFYWPTTNRNGPGSPNYGRIYDIGVQGTPTQRDGADILLNNVVSFDVKVWDPLALIELGSVNSGMPVYRGAYVDVRHPMNEFPYNQPVFIDGLTWTWNQNSPWAEGPQAAAPVGFNARWFDTGCARDSRANAADAVRPGPSPALPLQAIPGEGTFGPLAIPSIQVILRAYEPRSNYTRQVSFVVDM